MGQVAGSETVAGFVLPGPPTEWRGRLDLLDHLRNLLTVCVGTRIAYMNPAGVRMLGLASPQAAQGRSFFSFVHHDYAEAAALGLEVFADEADPVLIKLVRSDGSPVGPARFPEAARRSRGGSPRPP